MQLVGTAGPEARPPQDRASRAGAAPMRPRRGPRPGEVALMRGLAAGPRPVTEGPIGRCVKRGWCCALVEERGAGAARAGTVSFALTDLGRALIG